jgi:hypothetical protein
MSEMMRLVKSGSSDQIRAAMRSIALPFFCLLCMMLLQNAARMHLKSSEII